MAGDSKQQLAALYPHDPDAAATVYEAEGLRWVSHQELIDAGYTHLEDFSIIRINGDWYELQAHTSATYRILGHHFPAGMWWIERVPESVDTP